MSASDWVFHSFQYFIPADGRFLDRMCVVSRSNWVSHCICTGLLVAGPVSAYLLIVSEKSENGNYLLLYVDRKVKRSRLEIVVCLEYRKTYSFPGDAFLH